MWRASRSGHSFFPRRLHVAHQGGIGGKLPQRVDDLTAERTEIIVRRINLRGVEIPREQVRHLGRVRLGLFFLRTGQAVNEPIRIPMFEVSEAISLNMWKAFPPSISFRVSNDLLDTALYLYLVSNGSMRGIDRADNGSLRERSVWFDRGPQDLLNVDPSTTVLDSVRSIVDCHDDRRHCRNFRPIRSVLGVVRVLMPHTSGMLIEIGRC
ncbi:MAG: hypothetical protein BRD33_00280 [Bacteroidetes bacterium QH_6_63_17]|nr:MAG: hypothetical protein BRD33_00280 [Bacteroidetes bacterium QH_6_63_17]